MKILTLAVSLCAAGLLLHADTEQERLKNATAVLHEIMDTPDNGIPHDLLDKAHCAVIIPGMKSGGFVVGAKYGQGFAVCRHDHSGWGAPAAMTIEGGSFGFQAGYQNTDLVMLVMSDRGMHRLLQDKFTLGADAGVAAGPVGRYASALTDLQMRADILSWSRNRGVFAGVALTGAVLKPDRASDMSLYGKKVTHKELLTGNLRPTSAGEPLVSALDKYSPRETGNAPARQGEASRSKQTKKPEQQANPNATPPQNPPPQNPKY
jgi:lipid-binding SYLF domain-containing protein